jgi:hypothetical protein
MFWNDLAFARAAQPACPNPSWLDAPTAALNCASLSLRWIYTQNKAGKTGKETVA